MSARKPEQPKAGTPEYQRWRRKQDPSRHRKHLSNHARRRRDFLAEMKNVPCADCEGEFPPECMDFDHVRGEKSFEIGTGLRTTMENLENEIDKCDVVCSNCHRIRSNQRRLRLQSQNQVNQ